MGVIYGLLTALGWGTGDFLARGATRAIGANRTLFYVQLVGLLTITIYLIASGSFVVHGTIPPTVWLVAVFAGVLNLFCTLALFHAFEVGALVLVSPIIASYSVITVILSILSGETITSAHIVGIVAAVIGVLFVSVDRSTSKIDQRPGLPPGLWWAIAAALGYGVLFWVLGFGVTPYLGGVLPVWIVRVIIVGLLLLAALLRRVDLQAPRRSDWRALVLSGVLDTLGYAADTTGMQTGQVAIVTVLSSLNSAVVVLLACIFLHERLRLSQWLGALLVFAGIVLVSI